MLRLRYSGSIFVIVVSLSYAVVAQTAPPKSVLLNTAAFYDEKAGISKLVRAEKQINTEFAKDIKALQDDNAKLASIASELEKQPVTSANQAAVLARKEEGERLQRKLPYDKADLEAKINKRRATLIGPITFDIGKAISEFGRKNGYGAIFDASKLAESGALLFVGDSTDVTKDFIAFYNARVASVPIK
ncbi:MAG TPA: OmpH family outer membrane protein [Pyrinomonadaceae bacterium]|nr:OmpH family outer membrane protein [Pyrinomonadaceae bacterium]